MEMIARINLTNPETEEILKKMEEAIETIRECYYELKATKIEIRTDEGKGEAISGN